MMTNEESHSDPAILEYLVNIPARDSITTNIPLIKILKEISGNRKYIEGIGGWLFLTGDTNNKMEQIFGLRSWNDEEERRANQVIQERIDRISFYRKFIIPEKTIVYPEFLPDILRNWNYSNFRPALRLSNVAYLLPYLNSAKSMGVLYFRGDTHPSWLGSYFIYKAIMLELGISPIPFRSFTPSLAGYDGDLVSHMPEREKLEFFARVDRSPFTLDTAVHLTVTSPEAEHIGPDVYTGFSRESLVFEHKNRSLPKAVIFRDSTSHLLGSI